MKDSEINHIIDVKTGRISPDDQLIIKKPRFCVNDQVEFVLSQPSMDGEKDAGIVQQAFYSFSEKTWFYEIRLNMLMTTDFINENHIMHKTW